MPFFDIAYQVQPAAEPPLCLPMLCISYSMPAFCQAPVHRQSSYEHCSVLRPEPCVFVFWQECTACKALQPAIWTRTRPAPASRECNLRM